MNDNKPLQGYVILNTRPSHQAVNDSERLRQLGAEVLSCPLLDIEPCVNTPQLLPAPSVIIFCSRNAVDIFFKHYARTVVAWQAQPIWMSIGHATAGALKRFINAPVEHPEHEDSEHLLAMPALEQVSQQDVLIVKGEGGRGLLAQELINRGAKVRMLDVYRRLARRISSSFIEDLWQHRRVDIILITSEMALRHFYNQFAPQAHDWLGQCLWLLPSKRLQAVAQHLGLKRVLVASGPDWPQALIKYCTGITHD